MRTHALKKEEAYPRFIRLAKYPDGSLVIQGAYYWTQGFKVGYDWKAVPYVDVDFDGNTITNPVITHLKD